MNITPEKNNNYSNTKGSPTGGLNLQWAQSYGAQDNSNDTLNGNTVSFKEQMASVLYPKDSIKGKDEIENLLKEMDFAHTLSLNGGAKMDEKDVLFFLGLIGNDKIADMAPINFISDINQAVQNYSVEDIVKSSKVSKTLMDLLSTAHTTNKPVRVDFDNDITLVLRIDKEGKLSAQFYPGDKAAEEYLKNNLQYLKTRFDEQNIPYKELSYKQQRQQQQEKQENKR